MKMDGEASEDLEEITRSMHADARRILKDRPKRFKIPRAKIIDPIEKIIMDGLDKANIKYIHDSNNPKHHRLDFYLPTIGIFIEVKQFHSMRIAEQMARVDNVIVIQGRHAAEMFVKMINSSTDIKDYD
ncbi:hypothetical protein EVB96_142 [Rhizobium phage RHph_TM3_3_6]|nr:hypothetical protein EVB96_142 [Rhizobium phage RHph_TM3_3_6]